MPLLSVKLENCYGIKSFDEEFNFGTGKNVLGVRKSYAIYASNGTMKSSFADTFWAVQEQISNEPRDRMYPSRKTKLAIHWDGRDIEPECIYVVKTLDNKAFDEPPAGVARLLVNEKLKKEYESIFKSLRSEKDTFITKLKKISGSTDCEAELMATFSNDNANTIYEVLESLAETVTKGKHFRYTFKYNDVFDKAGKVRDFIGKHHDLLQEYSTAYSKLLDESDFFSGESSFGTYQAKQISKDVKEGEFFSAGHRFLLSNGGKEVGSSKQFTDIIEDEIERIVSDPAVRVIFTRIDTALQAHQNLRNFQKILEKDNSLVTKLENYDDFKKEVWYGFLSEVEHDFTSLVKSYISLKPKLNKIIKQADSEQKFWKSAVDEFNRRFKKLPFSLDVVNRKDVILNSNAPSIDFIFDDNRQEGAKQTSLTELKQTLSHGEKRALHLLSIIFDIKARIADSKETLFVIDDAVDSFDYKNKYAIVQYLKDITNVDNFYSLILTHNFDFFRTINSRGVVSYEDCKIAAKDGGAIILNPMVDFINPFENWKSHLKDDNSMLIASVPFARNLIEYINGKENDDYKMLCSVLHVKASTHDIKLKDIKNVYSNLFVDIELPEEDDENVYSLIITIAKKLAATSNDLGLHEKIVLSIGARLYSENFAREHIKEKSKQIVENIHNPTPKLFDLYKLENNSAKQEVLDILDDVLLMTPENIHLNAFMYEPIIDLGSDELKGLFNEIVRTLI